ncbi:uncharacterized protein KZ484_001662 [Pholidichthys leucotaenia]
MLDIKTEKTSSRSASPLEMYNNKQSDWIPNKEGIAVPENGYLPCRMWHSIPDMPLVLTVRKSPTAHKDTDKRETTEKETKTAEVKRLSEMFSVESVDDSAYYDTEDKEGTKYCENGNENLVFPQQKCPPVTDAAELPFEAQMNNAGQQMPKHLTNKTIQWEELPRVDTKESFTDRIVVWEELPKATPEKTRKLSEEDNTKQEIDDSVPTVTEFCGKYMMLDTDKNTDKGDGILELLVSDSFEFSTTAQKKTGLTLDNTATEKQASMDTEIAEINLHLEGPEDLELTVERSTPCSTAQHESGYIIPDTDYKQTASLETCCSITEIVGMPSKLPVSQDKEWLNDQTLTWKKHLQMKVNSIETRSTTGKEGGN